MTGHRRSIGGEQRGVRYADVASMRVTGRCPLILVRGALEPVTAVGFSVKQYLYLRGLYEATHHGAANRGARQSTAYEGVSEFLCKRGFGYS